MLNNVNETGWLPPNLGKKEGLRQFAIDFRPEELVVTPRRYDMTEVQFQQLDAALKAGCELGDEAIDQYLDYKTFEMAISLKQACIEIADSEDANLIRSKFHENTGRLSEYSDLVNRLREKPRLQEITLCTIFILAKEESVGLARYSEE